MSEVYMFQCQNEKCTHSFKAKPQHSNEEDTLVIIFQKCGAVHVAIDKTYQPLGVAEYRFKIKSLK